MILRQQLPLMLPAFLLICFGKVILFTWFHPLCFFNIRFRKRTRLIYAFIPLKEPLYKRQTKSGKGSQPKQIYFFFLCHIVSTPQYLRSTLRKRTASVIWLSKIVSLSSKSAIVLDTRTIRQSRLTLICSS